MEEFFTKVLSYSIKKCEKLLPLLIDFDLKRCIITETSKNSITGSNVALLPPWLPKKWAVRPIID